MRGRLLLGLLLVIALTIFWPLIPGWTPFGPVDFAGIPFCFLALWLLFSSGPLVSLYKDKR